MEKKDVAKLAEALQKAGAMNLDMKIGDLLKVEGLSTLDPNSPVGATLIAWDGYVAILPSKARDDLAVRDKDIRADLEGKLRDVLSDPRK